MHSCCVPVMWVSQRAWVRHVRHLSGHYITDICTAAWPEREQADGATHACARPHTHTHMETWNLNSYKTGIVICSFIRFAAWFRQRTLHCITISSYKPLSFTINLLVAIIINQRQSQPWLSMCVSWVCSCLINTVVPPLWHLSSGLNLWLFQQPSQWSIFQCYSVPRIKCRM